MVEMLKELTKPRKKLQRQDSFTKYPKAEAVACPVTMGKFVRRLVRHVSWAVDTRLPMQLHGQYPSTDAHEHLNVEEEVVVLKLLRRLVRQRPVAGPEAQLGCVLLPVDPLHCSLWRLLPTAI